MDVASGDERGRFDAAGRTSSPTTADGLVCVGGGGVLHGLDAADMTEQWRVAVGEKIWFPAAEGDAVYVPDESGTFAVVDLDTGRTRWTFDAGGALHTPPPFTDSTVYFGSHDGSLYAVDRDTGDERWQYFVGEGGDFEGVAAVPTVHEGLVHLAAPGHTLVALDAETGDVRSAVSHG